ncbi:MAG TPA: polyprenyl synthetase family protein [Dehalococcoidia bacterium]|nr:polyprenyl synthetase family protein [Dehalococcoidia bacterium]
MTGPDILNRHRDAIGREVGRSLAASNSPIDEMLRSYLGWTEQGLPSLAKCLRPSLCLSACEALGGDTNQALPIATAVELVHNFSLIHDDIEDGDELRHHRPTLWHAYGRQPAVYAGIALWSIANQTLDRALDAGLSAERVLQAHRILNDACIEMIEGQHQDISFEERGDVTLAEYIEMIGRKSGALLGASLKLGALVAGCDEEDLDRFDTFGRELGIAFQIRDDVLGIWGEGSATGKPVGADIARKKKSLPVVHAFQQVVGPDHDVLTEAYAKPDMDDNDINEVLSILQRWNCRYFAQGLAEDHRSRAMSILSRTPISPDARRAFDDLMSFVLERDY